MTEPQAEQQPERVLPSRLTSSSLDSYLPVTQAKAELITAHNDMLTQAFGLAGVTPRSNEDLKEAASGAPLVAATFGIDNFSFSCGTGYSEGEAASYLYLNFVGPGDWPTLLSRYKLSEVPDETIANVYGGIGPIVRTVSGSSEMLVDQLAEDLVLTQTPVEFLRSKLSQAPTASQ
jgi:hypothetical protein